MKYTAEDARNDWQNAITGAEGEAINNFPNVLKALKTAALGGRRKATIYMRNEAKRRCTKALLITEGFTVCMPMDNFVLEVSW
jgi:hypothetical protein